MTAVDESADMLAPIRGARTICDSIENLDLGEKFDGDARVVLGARR